MRDLYCTKAATLLLECVKLQYAPKAAPFSSQESIRLIRALAEREPFRACREHVDSRLMTKRQKLGWVLLRARRYRLLLGCYQLADLRKKNHLFG
jgi:hypothetical protein